MTDNLIDTHSFPKNYKSGFAAIIGKPNAGKSTLMNRILGTKLSIITPKAQTTRHRITGIYSDENGQIVFLDTPGFLEPKYKLHDKMMLAVNRSMDDADTVVLLLDPLDFPTETELEWLQHKIRNKAVLLVLNKTDIHEESRLSGAEEKVSAFIKPVETLRVSALTGEGVDRIVPAVLTLLPEGPPYYPPDQLSEHPERFFASELIREQLFLQYQEEIPYSCAVNIIQFDRKEDIDVIEAEIVVNRKSQKGIIIGKGGLALKKLGIAARKNIEEFTGRKVYLNIHVKVREKWREKDIFLRDYGYN